MTTHETSFFRDRPFWKELETTILPALVGAVGAERPLRSGPPRARPGRRPTPWRSSSKSSVLRSPSGPRSWRRRSQRSPSRRPPGASSPWSRSIGAFKTRRLVAHFDQDSEGFRVKESLRRRITWSHHNLLGNQPFPRLRHRALQKRPHLLQRARPESGAEVLDRLRPAQRLCRHWRHRDDQPCAAPEPGVVPREGFVPMNAIAQPGAVPTMTPIQAPTTSPLWSPTSPTPCWESSSFTRSPRSPTRPWCGVPRCCPSRSSTHHHWALVG